MMKNKKISALCIILPLSLLLSACGKTEDVPDVIVDSEENVISYSLVTASVEDVILTKKIDCTSVQTDQQEVSFSVTGKYVDKVYVREGDTVKKGDLLCELSSAALEEEIENLTYTIKRNELQLGYLDADEALDVQDAWLNSFGGDPEERVKQIKSSYARQRQLLNDTLEFDREKLNKKRSELSKSRLYATMDGMVYKLKKNLEGSTSKADTVIMTIVDKSEDLFMVKGLDYKDLFSENDMIDMKVSYSTAAGDYIVTPYKMDTWTENMYFIVYTGPDGATLEVGTSGTITVELDSKSQVLSIPVDVLHQAEDKYYVYTLNEDNNREIRYIEIGLKGDERAEVLSGLSEGEKVVKK